MKLAESDPEEKVFFSLCIVGNTDPSCLLEEFEKVCRKLGSKQKYFHILCNLPSNRPEWLQNKCLGLADSIFLDSVGKVTSYELVPWHKSN